MFGRRERNQIVVAEEIFALTQERLAMRLRSALPMVGAALAFAIATGCSSNAPDRAAAPTEIRPAQMAAPERVRGARARGRGADADREGLSRPARRTTSLKLRSSADPA